MAQTYRILVRCPATGKAIETGITTTGRDALSSGIFEEGKASCHHCHQMHGFREHAFIGLVQDTAPDGIWRPNP